MLNNNEIFNRSGKVFYISMKQNIYLKPGLMKGVSRNISNMRCSVSSPDETLRRELKIRCAAEYF